MPKTQAKTQVNSDQTIDFEKIVDLIDKSALSEGKKLAYIFMIAEGTFSLDTMKGLLKDLEAAGGELQHKLDEQAVLVADYGSKINSLEEEIMDLMDEVSIEHQSNLDKILDAASMAAEISEIDSKEEKLAKIKRKLQK